MNEILNVDIIEEYIKSNGLTQKEFCAQCNVSKYAFYKIMRSNRFSLIALFRVAKKLNMPVYKLFK